MAELVPLVPVEDEETDHKILEMRVAGLSVHQNARQLAVPQYEVLRRLHRSRQVLGATYRGRDIALSLLRIDELTETFHKEARGGDIEAGNPMVRLEAERRALLGLTGSNYDPVQLVASNVGEKSTASLQRA